MLQDATAIRVVLFEGEGAQPLDAATRFSALKGLLEKGYTVSCSVGERWIEASPRETLLVLGKFQGSTVTPGPQDRVELRDLSAVPVDQLSQLADEARARAQAFEHGAWKPWFPVIDYDRCTNCMQCLSFCLFGVYGVSEEQKIQVQNNDNCKTNCPACSRVCPEAAIMFPKYKAGPINGDQVSDADLQREKMKIDISALLGGDVYQLLRDRSARAKSRFSKERDSDKALQERQKCLVKLQQMGDIPPEVLMSLPSPEEIQRRAAEATAKAKTAINDIARLDASNNGHETT